MKPSGSVILLILVYSSIFAAPDDSLKGNANSRFLSFPFFLRSPETDWGFGAVGAYFFKAKKNDHAIRTSDINLVSLVTLREQVVVVLGSTVFFPEEKEILRLQTSYSYYPDKCWGKGNTSPAEFQEDYSIHQFYFNPQWLKKIFYNWYAGVSYEFQHISDFLYTTNGVFDQQLIAGRKGGITSGLGLLLTWDTRNNAYSPYKGSFAELNITRDDHKFGSEFDFRTITVDVRKFISLSPDHKNVLALQVIAKDNEGYIPFRGLSFLGGPEIMRGYYKGRFIDNDMFAFQAEYRRFLFWRFGVAVFAALGEVSAAIHDLNVNGIHYALGGGLRLMVSKSEKLNLRLDYGIGKNSNGLYVILKEAF